MKTCSPLMDLFLSINNCSPSSGSVAMKEDLSELQFQPDGREGKLVTLCFDEEERMLHDLIACQIDMSHSASLQEYLDGFKGLVVKDPTPGCPHHESVYTKDEFKEVLREIYVLFRCLHERDYSLGGNFGMENFLLDESRMRISAKFANLPNRILQKGNSDGKRKDLERLVRLIRWEMFKGKCVPHDVNLWLSMIFEKEIEELLPYHSSLMSLEECGDAYLVWYDKFLDLQATNKTAYDNICFNLTSYDDWQQKLLMVVSNDHLVVTMGVQPYQHKFSDLARLLRNSRNHDGRYQHEKFALIIGQHYPNLLSDFQRELFFAGCFRRKFRVPK